MSAPWSGLPLDTRSVPDPGPDGLLGALDWAEALPKEDPLHGALDLEHLGLSGHSAGGTSTGPTVGRDVPLAPFAGSCDGVVPEASVREGVFFSEDAELVVLPGAGHLAFSDMCALELETLAADVLEPRDDLNDILYDSLLALGTDGCPPRVPDADTCDEGAYMDLSTSADLLRGATTAFFDLHLRGEGPGLEGLTE